MRSPQWIATSTGTSGIEIFGSPWVSERTKNLVGIFDMFELGM